jgi:hypothetical protein
MYASGVRSRSSFYDVATERDGYTLDFRSVASRRKFEMKRIVGLTLLVALSVPWSIPVKEGERRSRKADKKQEKINKKAAKKQRKAMKKAAKAQRKADKKANRSYR